MKFLSRFLLFILVLIAFPSCDGDKITPPKEVLVYDVLQNKDAVLFNLELAYNERNRSEFEKLLDDNFAFVFSVDDYRGGYTPRHWGEASELDANRKIMDPSLDGGKRVVSIELKLNYPEDDWTEEAPNVDHPDESWYTRDVSYSFTVKMADDWEHRAMGAQAQFKIRWNETEGRWGIVKWRDDSGTEVASSPGGTTVDETTWGGLKALYSDRPYEDLTSKDDVLYNLEFAYNRRDFTQFEKLLGEDFVFTFSEADFNSGEVDFPQWNRASELAANQKILDPNLPGDKRVTGIDLRLYFPTFAWTEIPPNQDHPDESWYTKTVDYDLVTRTADGWEHRAIRLRAQYTIRWSDSPGHWQIVLWRDDVSGMIALSPGGTAIEETTWGSFKSLYSR